MAADETGCASVVSFTYDGWSAKLGAPISCMTFHFVNANWNSRTFPLCFFDTEENRQVRGGPRGDNGRGGELKRQAEPAMFSDNEPSVALGVALFLNFSGSVRCVCHTLALAVDDSVGCCEFLLSVLECINAVRTYVKSHTRGGGSVRTTALRRFYFRQNCYSQQGVQYEVAVAFITVSHLLIPITLHNS